MSWNIRASLGAAPAGRATRRTSGVELLGVGRRPRGFQVDGLDQLVQRAAGPGTGRPARAGRAAGSPRAAPDPPAGQLDDRVALVVGGEGLQPELGDQGVDPVLVGADPLTPDLDRDPGDLSLACAPRPGPGPRARRPSPPRRLRAAVRPARPAPPATTTDDVLEAMRSCLQARDRTVAQRAPVGSTGFVAVDLDRRAGRLSPMSSRPFDQPVAGGLVDGRTSPRCQPPEPTPCPAPRRW